MLIVKRFWETTQHRGPQRLPARQKPATKRSGQATRRVNRQATAPQVPPRRDPFGKGCLRQSSQPLYSGIISRCVLRQAIGTHLSRGTNMTKLGWILFALSLITLSCQEQRMTNTNQLYTHGLWIAKPGNEQAFITEWSNFAKWTAKHQSGAGTGYLLQDRERPQEFISFGPWDNENAISAWRQRPEFKAFVSKIRGLCDDFQPRSLSVVATSAD